MAILDPGQIIALISVLVVIFIATYIFFRKDIGRCKSNTDLTAKTVIVTGANCGIGYHTALDLAKRNARVILACRNEAKAEEAKQKIKKESGNDNVVVRIVDLSLMSSVRKFADRIITEEERLDILVNNAGVICHAKPNRDLTEEGLEWMFATNHFGPFLLTNLLLDLMKKSAPSRIVTVSSVMQKFGKIEFDNLQAEKSFKYHTLYFDSKLANVLFTRELARKLEGTGVTANVLHPGSCVTEGFRNNAFPIRVLLLALIRIFCKSAEEGAQTSIYLAVSDEVKDINGKYFSDCDLAENSVNPVSRDTELTAKLWDVSEKLTGLSSP